MARNSFFIRLFAFTLPFALGGCDSMIDWADRNGPVIGQRCEHWQCFTEGGQQESEAIHAERMKQEAAAAHGTVPAENPGSTPVTPAATSATPSAAPGSAAPVAGTQQLAPPMPPEGAYIYVPRAAATPAATPVDGQSQPPAQ